MTHDSEWACFQPDPQVTFVYFFTQTTLQQNLLNSILLTYVYDFYIFSIKFLFSV